jgi:hypothetical protein
VVINLTRRIFTEDFQNNKTMLSTGCYKGIYRELSSEERITKGIVYYVLNKLCGKTMWWDWQTGCDTQSKCSDEDTFDPKTGRDICNIKSDLNYHKKMYDRYLKVAWVLRRVSNRLMEYVDLHQKKIERLERNLDQYVR